MDKQMIISDLRKFEAFFNKSTNCLTEADSQFRPKEKMRSVAQMVAHVALTIDWFIDGAFSPTGFKLDFEDQEKRVMEYGSLDKAREWFKRAIDNAVITFSDATPEEINAPINDTQIVGPKSRWAIIQSIAEHTAHHRGALTVYSRLLGKVPEMPYV